MGLGYPGAPRPGSHGAHGPLGAPGLLGPWTPWTLDLGTENPMGLGPLGTLDLMGPRGPRGGGRPGEPQELIKQFCSPHILSMFWVVGGFTGLGGLRVPWGTLGNPSESIF